MKKAVLLAALVMALSAMLGSAAYAKMLTGTNGPDRIVGTKEMDSLYGLGGADRLFGMEQPDQLYGGGGNDQVHGNRGGDYIEGGEGLDILLGELGNDNIVASDGRHDYVNCGVGNYDRASVDKSDTVVDCEFVNGKHVGDDDDDDHGGDHHDD